MENPKGKRMTLSDVFDILVGCLQKQNARNMQTRLKMS